MLYVVVPDGLEPGFGAFEIQVVIQLGGKGVGGVESGESFVAELSVGFADWGLFGGDLVGVAPEVGEHGDCVCGLDDELVDDYVAEFLREAEEVRLWISRPAIRGVVVVVGHGCCFRSGGDDSRM